MTVLSGADVVLADGVLPGASLIIDDGRIAGIEARPRQRLPGADVHDVTGMTLAPGFVDVHVHGVEGVDVLDGADAVAQVAARLPRYGVTAFCPTSVACAPAMLATFLAAVERARLAPAERAAQVLPAHLESNFINPAWAGAQPAACLRTASATATGHAPGGFGADDILHLIHRHRPGVAIVTLAPEMPGGLDLVRLLVADGHLVSIGHSGATYDEARQAIDAGVTHATHLFNRMTPLQHREPGVVGAVLASPRVTAEMICDGFHVHPSVVALAVRAMSVDRVMAITDGSACAGLPVGAHARLGGRVIVATANAAELEDGTLAGSVATMDRAFRTIVRDVGLSLVEAARLCATTPCRQLGLRDRGRLAVGQAADLVVLDADLRVAQTWISGRPVLEH